MEFFHKPSIHWGFAMAQEVPPNGPWLSRGSTRWAVYVAHFLSEPRVRSALLRQLLTSHARATPLADPAELLAEVSGRGMRLGEMPMVVWDINGLHTFIIIYNL